MSHDIRIDSGSGTPRMVPMTKAAIEFGLRVGYILIAEFSAIGGLTFERADTKKRSARGGASSESAEQEIKVVRRVDHQALYNESKNLVARAYYIMDNMTQHTPLGYFVDESLLVEVTKAMDEVKKGAEAFNEIAKSEGSERRVLIDVYALPLVDTQPIKLRIAKMVRDRLEELKAALRIGDKAEFKRLFYRTTYFGKMLEGPYDNIVEQGLRNAKEENGVLVRKLKEGGDPKKIGERLTLSQLDEAIRVFNRAIERLEK